MPAIAPGLSELLDGLAPSLPSVPFPPFEPFNPLGALPELTPLLLGPHGWLAVLDSPARDERNEMILESVGPHATI
jgi:hypothetical protein